MTTAVKLACLDGSPAPPELTDALRRLGEIDREQRGDLLAQILEPLADDQLDGRIGRLCRRLDLSPENAAPGLKAGRFVIRTAAAMCLDREALAADLTLLDAGHLTDLLDVYERALPALRAEIVQASIVAHGRVLMGVEWRVDTLGASNRGRKLNVPVAMMTFHCQNGTQTEHVTMQLVPEMVAQLRDVCERLLK